MRQRRDFFPFGEEVPGDANHGNRSALLDGGFVTYNASLSINQQFTEFREFRAIGDRGKIYYGMHP